MLFGIILTGNVFAKYTIERNNLIIETNLDRTIAKATVTYSNSQIINQDVIVTIKCNEKMKDLDGWNISDDKMTFTKTFQNNISKDVELFDLAGNKTIVNINITNIDKEKPKVECISISNSNTDYSLYANSKKTINLSIKITDNIQLNNIDTSKITVKVNSNNANLTKQLTEVSSNLKEKTYNLKLTNVLGDGKLNVIFEDGFVNDTALNNNIKTDVATNILIDNTKPAISYSQAIIAQGKVKAMLNSSEIIRNLNGWNITNDKKQLYKEFVSNVSYELDVTDLAGNVTTTSVTVTGATFINLIYASHNSNIGWTYGFGNYDIAGKQSVLTNSLFKTEALAFHIEGNIANDFVMGRAYVFDHWGAESQARCKDSNMLYKYGYNPGDNSWKTMASSDLVTIDGKKYFQFGGAGINGCQNTDINGNNPIPADIANQFHYGMSSISLALKDYTDYSIIYQIYIGEAGWLEVKSDGQEAVYSREKPMSAFRVAIIPKSEKQNQINTWNKDKGTFIR